MRLSLMVRTIFLAVFIVGFQLAPVAAQDLSGLSICVDPGHGKGTPNQGPTGLREADINLGVSLFLKEFLKRANIDTVLLTRVDDSTNPTLSQREDLANGFGVDWFHSVHHNACGAIGTVCNARRTLLLIEEKRTFANPCPDGRAGGTGQPEWPGQSDIMSDLMGNWIFQALRTTSFSTWLDWTFYGGCGNPNSFSLGVLNDLLMPGELSEATFHQNLIEENKLRNPDFLKLEARALFMAILDFYEAGTLPTGVLAGIITSDETGAPINGAQALLTPVNLTYTVDNNNNGLYVFHDLSPGTYQVEVTAPGFDPETRSVTVRAHDFSFWDFALASALPPVVELTLPLDQTQNYSVYNGIGVRFSRPMNQESVEAAFSTTPGVEGVFTWGANDEVLLFEPKVRFEFDTKYTVQIAGTAFDRSGRFLDGNGDGSGGDDFAFSFNTIALDTTRPVILNFFPTKKDTGIFLKDVFWVEFSRELDPASLNAGTILLTGEGNRKTDIQIDYVAGGASRVTIIPKEKLLPNVRYFMTITPSVRDVDGAQMEKSLQWQFRTQSQDIQTNFIENFEAAFPWADPEQSGFTQGTVPDSTFFRLTQDKFISEDNAGELGYEFSGQVGFLQVDYLGQYPLELSEGKGVGFYVYGDNSQNVIRLFFTDIDGIEALPWTLIDWSGWKLLRFDLATVQLQPGINGNGNLDGTEVALGGIQLNFVGENKGVLIFDDLVEINPELPSAVEPAQNDLRPPKKFALFQNFPNPFNPETLIGYQISGSGNATQKVVLSVYNLQGQRVRTLVNEEQSPGAYSVLWDGKDQSGHRVASGIYLYQLKAGKFMAVKKMLVLR